MGSQNVREAIPLFMVTSMKRSLEFYIDKLGFSILHKWEPRGSIEWCCLGLEGASLMLQEYRQDPPPGKPGIGVSIYFICNDALGIYRQIRSRDLSPTEPFVGNNMWVFGLNDPDGYAIFFESATNVPEGTTYSERFGPAA